MQDLEIKKKLNNAIKDIKSQGAKIIIGPISHEDFEEVKKYNDLIFVSPSNITPEFKSNIISVGISLESQLMALNNFIKTKKIKRLLCFLKINMRILFNKN